MHLNKNKLDVSQILLTYIALIGDVEKTAAALELDPEIVQKLADAEGWNVKIQRITLMAKSGRQATLSVPRTEPCVLCRVTAFGR